VIFAKLQHELYPGAEIAGQVTISYLAGTTVFAETRLSYRS